MRFISQSLFSWQVLDESSDIFRFRKMLDALDDGKLIRQLVKERKGRRNDYPIGPVWNSLLAGLIFGHRSIASLIRELRRNGELRQACGFDPLLKEKAVPSPDAYSRFLKKLTHHQSLLENIFHHLVDRLSEYLPDLGRHLGMDGKAIKACRKDDAEASVGCKKQGHPDDYPDQVVTYEWFGYKLHMLCDVTYELPLTFEVTSAREHESPHLISLMQDFKKHHEPLVERAKTFTADKGYDDGEDKERLYEEYGVAPVIPSRDLKTKESYEPLVPSRHDTIYLSSTGEVMCKIRPFATTDHERFAPMYYMGFEKKRGTLKFRCPAAAWGIECQNHDACRCSRRAKESSYGRIVRVPLERERRLLGPIYPHSYRFENLYKNRTSLERLFFRLDHLYGFEHHTTRGLARMRVRMSMALIAMLATALGWIQANRVKDLRRMFQVV